MNGRRRLFFIALIVVAAPRAGQAGELAGSVNVRNGIVYVEVDDDGKPAVGVKVRLQEVRTKEVVAQGKINAEGKWSWPLLKAGAYEVIIDSIQAGESPLVLPVDQREQVDSTEAKSCPHHTQPPEGAHFLWLPVGLGLGLVGCCGMAVWGKKWKRRLLRR